MRVAILGRGNMGRGLATRLAGEVDLLLGTRDADAAADFAASLRGEVTVTDYDSAARDAEVVVLALHYGPAIEEAGRNPHLAGKVVIDITNPLTEDFSGLTLGFDTSAAERIAAASSARVVKAYNTIFADVFELPRNATADVPVFVAGDDAEAVATVSDVVGRSGFAIEVTGGLETARFVEPLGMLNIRLGYHQGLGTRIAPAWLRVEN